MYISPYSNYSTLFTVLGGPGGGGGGGGVNVFFINVNKRTGYLGKLTTACFITH